MVAHGLYAHPTAHRIVFPGCSRHTSKRQNITELNFVQLCCSCIGTLVDMYLRFFLPQRIFLVNFSNRPLLNLYRPARISGTHLFRISGASQRGPLHLAAAQTHTHQERRRRRRQSNRLDCVPATRSRHATSFAIRATPSAAEIWSYR